MTKKEMISKCSSLIWKWNEGSLLNTNSWINRLYRSYIVLLSIMPDLPFVVFFGNYSKIIHNAIDNNETKREQLKRLLFRALDDSNFHKKMFIQCILYGCGLMDEETVVRIIASAKKSTDYGYKYWTTMDISYMTFSLGTGIYSRYFSDRRMLMEELSTAFREGKRGDSEQKRKLCVLVYQLNPNIHNSAQRVAMMMANNMEKYYEETLVLCLDSAWRNKKEKKQYYTISRPPRSEDKKDEIRSKFNSDIKVEYAEGRDYLSLVQDGINKLYSFDPMVIIDICDEYSPASHIYSRDFYTVYMPLRVGLTSQAVSSLLGRRDGLNELLKIYDCELPESIIEWSFPEYVPPNEGVISRDELLIPKNAFVIMTIGHCESIDNDLTDHIRKLLESDNEYVWALVGGSGPAYMHQTCQELFNRHQIMELGYVNNLAGLCSSCDVVLRQNVSGGSGGTAIAAMQGLPVVMTDRICDPNRWLGNDYSVIEDEEGLIEEIKRLKNDSEYYQQRSSQVKKLVNSITDNEEHWRQLNMLINDSYQSWKKKEYNGKEH